MTAPEWGRVNRGRVWHLVTGPCTVLCEPGLQGGGFTPYVEVTEGLPPRGGRPCPRCCAVVLALEEVVTLAIRQGPRQAAAEPDASERPVEDVDLVGALIEAQRPACCSLHDDSCRGPDWSDYCCEACPHLDEVGS